MTKKELIINTLAFMQKEEYKLLSESSMTLGEIVDVSFTDEEKSYVKLMSRLYEIYDDLEKEDKEFQKERLREQLAKRVDVVEAVDSSKILKCENFSFNDEVIRKLNENLQKYIPPTPTMDLSKFK